MCADKILGIIDLTNTFSFLVSGIWGWMVIFDRVAFVNPIIVKISQRNWKCFNSLYKVTPIIHIVNLLQLQYTQPKIIICMIFNELQNLGSFVKVFI